MKNTGIVICVLAALVGLAGCASVVSSDKTDRTKSGIESQGKFKVIHRMRSGSRRLP